MAHILCINPWIYDFAAYNYWIEPLGLLTIASLLRRVGHDVTLLDCLDRHHPDAPAPRTKHDRYGCGPFAKTEVAKPPVLAHVPRRWSRYGLPVDVFEAELHGCPRPDVVLITSMMTYWYPGPFEAIRRVKACWPSVPVALGGVYATLCSAHARAFSGADAVFAGPGQGELLSWIERVAGDKPIASLANQPGGAGDHVLFPAHDLRRRQGFVAVLTASGCPFQCPYCAVHQLSASPFAPRPPAQVVDEIAWCVESLGAQDVAFYDDALLFDAQHHIHPLLDDIIARHLRLHFHTPNGLHARYIDRPLALKMRQAGFVTIRLGLESADPAQQQHDGSKIDRTRFASAV
ncbi:MAG: radical SAM protein, partial [Anaerolineae bacterium]|nr:radical SAM protein [Anaerolineae bacterium]